MTWLGVCLHRSHRCGGICRLSYSPQRNCTQSGHLQATCTCRTKKPRGHLPIFVLWGLNGQRSEPCDVLSQVLHEETAFALPVKNRSTNRCLGITNAGFRLPLYSPDIGLSCALQYIPSYCSLALTMSNWYAIIADIT